MKTIFSLLFTLLFFTGFGQIQRPRNLPKELREEYRDTLKDAKKTIADLKKEGWDILPSPVEVPLQIASQRDLFNQAISNWGERLILPAAIRARLVAECKFSVYGKICDTGRPNHPDINTATGEARNYTTAPTADDLQGHSTHVAGIAVAKDFGILEALQNSGVYVQAYRKILGDQGQGSFTWIENLYRTEAPEDKAMNARGIAVVYNGSFGTTSSNLIPGVESVLAEATKNDAYFIFAAGNHNGSPGYPGSSPYSITCAALDESLVKASYSCYGPQVNNAMPGSAIQSTWLQGQYAKLSGTSMASPFLYAATVVAKSKWGPKIKGTDQMRKYLGWVSADLGAPGKDNLYGWGLVFIQRILDGDPTKMPGYNPGDPGNPTPPLPAPPTDPVIPEKKENTANLYFPAFRNQVWKTQGSQNSFKLACRFTIQVTSKRYAEDVWTTLDQAIARNFANQYMVVSNDNDYHDVLIWAQHFLGMYLRKDPEVTKLGLTFTITRVDGYDESNRWGDIPNPKAKLNGSFAAKVSGEGVQYAGKNAKSKLKL